MKFLEPRILAGSLFPNSAHADKQQKVFYRDPRFNTGNGSRSAISRGCFPGSGLRPIDCGFGRTAVCGIINVRQMNMRYTAILFAFLVSLQVGCVQLAVVGSTQNPRYASMIGRQFALKEDFLVRGVRWDLRATRPDYILMMPATKPGIGGPEFTELGVLPKGSRFEIVGAVDRTSTLFPETSYVARFAPDTIAQVELATVRFHSSHLFPLLLKPAAPGEAPHLSEVYFQPLPE